jgi:predicted AAA+ superfamily ATPase
MLDVFRDIADIDLFFARLQLETGVHLYTHDSCIIFDEVQLYPKARQAIKHLVADGRYHYIETGSLLSIKKMSRTFFFLRKNTRSKCILWITKSSAGQPALTLT